MLEKIGLPAKPSLRGSNWVVDASHCQACSSQFTFINRKHHCRRCGGLFCNTCTQQRMVLRGQGDSRVRICEPCKKLEEAARFELRYGHKGRAGKGSSKMSLKDNDEVSNHILGTNVRDSNSSGRRTNSNTNTIDGTGANSASSSTTQDVVANSSLQDEMASASPEELRQQAVEEKRKYKILKGEGKPEEALKAYKRGKELERQADALELSIRRNRRRVLSSRSNDEILNKDGKESDSTNKQSRKVGKEKDDLAAELKELGWSDMDLGNEDRKPASTSLESELSSLLGDVSQKTSKDLGPRSIDKTPVIALKRKALALKREGKLTEAKEELKKAKVLEKELEEQELLAEAEDSDDELSAMIRSMDDDDQEEILIQNTREPDFNFDHLVAIANDLAEGNFEVTDEDMEDPEIVAALKSIGWSEDTNIVENIAPISAPLDRETLSREILTLKREALNQKRTGNVAEAMDTLKKAKLLERELERFEPQENLSKAVEGNGRNADFTGKESGVGLRSRLTIQKELLGLKKRALALRREGRLHEAEEELKKSKILEHQLGEMDNPSKVKAAFIKNPDLAHEQGEDDVTDQDLHDPAYLSALKSLGWDEESELTSHPPKSSKKKDDLSANKCSVTQAASDVSARASNRSRAEIQRELLSLKRKALSLRRQGQTDKAEEVLKMAKALEAQLADLDAPKTPQVESSVTNNRTIEQPLGTAVKEGDEEEVTENDMHDPALLLVLKNLGWKEEDHASVVSQETPYNKLATDSLNATGSSVMQSALDVEVSRHRSRGEMQRQLLDLKRKALALRRKGETEEAEELLKTARALERQMEEPEFPKEHSSVETGGSTTPSMGPMVPDNMVAESLQPVKDESPLLLDSSGELGSSGGRGAAQPSGFVPPPVQSVNLTDLLTGDSWSSSAIPSVQIDTFPNLGENPENRKESKTENREENVDVHETPCGDDANSVLQSVSHGDQTSLQQEVLARKKKAVALKREGKLAEAREELRQAKLLEKSLEEDTKPRIIHPDASVTTSVIPSIEQKELHSSMSAPKPPLSSRERFKLQQESLSHKRQALKLRREGRTDEAEAEFEKAKILEAQLEDQSVNVAENTDNIVVEDLLDSQLLSALKAIGLDDANVISQSKLPERPEPMKPSNGKRENSSQERVQLEERIKVEKVKAVNLKRSGKQSEALDALRRAKFFEKKLNSLA